MGVDWTLLIEDIPGLAGALRAVARSPQKDLWFTLRAPLRSFPHSLLSTKKIGHRL